MKIVVVSRSWPSDDRSGVSLVAAEHVRLMLAAGHEVVLLGSYPQVGIEGAELRAHQVASSGSGSLYAPARVDNDRLQAILREERPELIVCEAWQTALTDAAIEAGYGLGIPVLMISHGISVLPYDTSFASLLRACAWTWYRWFRLPGLLTKLDAITALDMDAGSNRFHDRDLARRRGIPLLPLVNSAVNFRIGVASLEQRRRSVLVIGYFSPVKNQLQALRVLQRLPDDIEMIFIGRRSGGYFRKCLRAATQLGLEQRVRFLQDNECNIGEELGQTTLVLSTSITEVLPVTLLEAMASGTPYVAHPVGAIPNLGAGLLAVGDDAMCTSVQQIFNDPRCWAELSVAGRRQYLTCYSAQRVAEQLAAAIAAAMASSGREPL